MKTISHHAGESGLVFWKLYLFLKLSLPIFLPHLLLTSFLHHSLTPTQETHYIPLHVSGCQLFFCLPLILSLFLALILPSETLPRLLHLSCPRSLNMLFAARFYILLLTAVYSYLFPFCVYHLYLLLLFSPFHISMVFHGISF